ncbi:electron transport complex subunit RsxC [Spongiibacter nanhainus]|uniref:Ion-translocating oxidoreductase complex subunit C n=1 Tax=Spongiibacter nanhainus TaxID=2794344 RepID=A0A7T4QZD6_9GAMM|nr:electron transport complex subunit RsxC [Spongiibacter nanhainus]QQD17619.1 electron transport complex subunit RsxC [Spongiibacter nanhainus]
MPISADSHSDTIKVWDIHGGVHPPENKHQSLGEPIQSAGIPPRLILPLSQHIGAPAAPLVEVGDKVLKGQQIAEAKGLVSAPIHAPTSGVIAAIEPRVIPHPSGMSAPCIILDTDGEDTWIPHQGVEDFRSLDKPELLKRIREAGIAGMGGAGFPSAVKLGGTKAIDTLILNGTECEPYITADDILMRERAEQIIAGAEILRHLVAPSERTVIGVEDNKPEGIAALRKAAEGTGIQVAVFPTKYPSGGEKQLIEILTGREVPSGGLPADIGVVCQNIGTAVAIYRAIRFGEPLISRVTTVTGEACGHQRNYEVLLGTPVQYLLDRSEFDASRCIRLVMGGPMMGYTLPDTGVPIVKTSNCVLAPTVEELPPPPPAQACIRCGMCAEACPVSLLPQQMYWYARSQEYDKLEEHNLFDCIECGACSYACPSHIPLVQYYRAAKGEIRQAEQDRIKAERSKERFEARQARIEKEAAEKEAKKRARLEAAKAKQNTAAKPVSDNDNKSDIIQAAIERSKAKKAQQSDPATAAIERAQAKRSGKAAEETPQEQQARLEKLVASTEKRLESAKEKLAQAEAEGSDKVEAFRSAVTTTEKKLQGAREELAALDAPPATAASSPQDQSAELDPAQAAIARAQAKRAGADAPESDEDKTQRLQQQIASTEKRLKAAEARWQEAQQQGGSKAEALAAGVEKTREKLDAARQELASHQATLQTGRDNNGDAADSPSDDPAQAAIARAMAAREAAANLSETDKLAQSVESLEKRIARSREKLDAARQAGDDTVDALETALQKLETKLSEAQGKLAEAKGSKTPQSQEH